MPFFFNLLQCGKGFTKFWTKIRDFQQVYQEAVAHVDSPAQVAVRAERAEGLQEERREQDQKRAEARKAAIDHAYERERRIRTFHKEARRTRKKREDTGERIPAALRMDVLERDRHTCVSCGRNVREDSVVLHGVFINSS